MEAGRRARGEPEFWREFAAECRATKVDCCLLGELMHGDYNRHVGPGLLDSGTNYQLSKALWSSLNDHNYWELSHSYERDQSMYGNLTLLNFLGNHDQCRIYFARLNDPANHYPLAAASLPGPRHSLRVLRRRGRRGGRAGRAGRGPRDAPPLDLADALREPRAQDAVRATSELVWLGGRTAP